MVTTQLTQDDIDLLRHLSTGMNVSEISARTGRSPRQVRQHVRAVRAELGAKTNIQAVVVAVRRSII